MLNIAAEASVMVTRAMDRWSPTLSSESRANGEISHVRAFGNVHRRHFVAHARCSPPYHIPGWPRTTLHGRRPPQWVPTCLVQKLEFSRLHVSLSSWRSHVSSQCSHRRPVDALSVYMCHMSTYSNLRLEVLCPLAAKKNLRTWAVTPLPRAVAHALGV